MKVFTASANVPLKAGLLPASAVTIGNFDGCHLGHQELIRQTRQLSQEKGNASVVLTFDPNPKQFFKANRTLGKLFKTDQKIRALEELGVDYLVIQSFDYAFSQLSPQQFYEQLLRAQLQAQTIVVGHDFCFGAQREGNVRVLRDLARADGCEVVEVSQQLHEGEVISSSRIRHLLQEHDLLRANQLMGRPYLIEGTVVAGKKLGRTLGFPTANLDVGEQLLPSLGVYAGFAQLGDAAPIFHLEPKAIPCILNIGLRPTVDQASLTPKIEVHLLEGSYEAEGLYEQKLSVALTDFIRDERKFASLDELKQQIALDCETARQRLRQARSAWS